MSSSGTIGSIPALPASGRVSKAAAEVRDAKDDAADFRKQVAWTVLGLAGNAVLEVHDLMADLEEGDDE